MENHKLNTLLNRLIAVTEELAQGRFGTYDDLFELTKDGQYPPYDRPAGHSRCVAADHG